MFHQPHIIVHTIFYLFLTFSTLTMEKNELANQVALMRDSLINEGYLNDQFIRVEELQGAENPNFVEETVNLYFSESAQLMIKLEKGLGIFPIRDESLIDFQSLDRPIYRIKGSSASIGAKKVDDLALDFQDYMKAENAKGCKKVLEQLKIERATLEDKLQDYFNLARQLAGPADGASSSK